MLRSLLRSLVKTLNRRMCTIPVQKSGFVDVNKKVVYGGNLLSPVSDQSFGSVLFNRMLQMDRREDLFQVCAETKQQMKTREFLRSAVAVAEVLKGRGAQKGDFVFLLGNNSLNINIVLVGVLLIAAVPFPISYKTPIERFQNILKTIKPKFFWCERQYLFAYQRPLLEMGGIGIDPANIFFLDQRSEVDSEGFEDLTRGRGENFENFQPTQIENSKEELALVLNSISYVESGWVVGITHDNLNNVIARYEDADFNVGQRYRVSLMVQKVFWITGLYPFFFTCSFGSTLVVMKKFHEENFLKCMKDYNVTDVFMFSSKWWRLFKHIPDGIYDLSNCKWAYAVNETVPEVLKNAIKERYGMLLNSAYGLTETTGLIFLNSHYEKGLTVGKLFPGTYAKVVSTSTSQSVGPTEGGELCLKGPTITKGYLNNKKATHQLFDDEGFFLTGLYGYYDENGNFYVSDRIVYQIVYKNHKISPKNIEAVIRSLPAVRDVCVSGISHKRDGAYPIALVVHQKGQKLTEAEIIAYVNERVPDYQKLRGGVIFVSKIPRIRETGAINRKLLNTILSKYQMKDDRNALNFTVADKR